VPFCYYEAAINKVTNDKFDPVAKIPELKYCAIRVTAGGTEPEQVSFGGGQILRKVQEEAMEETFAPAK
jgi:formate dehydrogenase major subunit